MRELFDDDQRDPFRLGVVYLLGESAAIVVKGVFASDKDAGRRIFLKDGGWGQERTDFPVALWSILWIFKVGFEANFEESMRENHVIQSCQQTRTVVIVI